MAAAMSTYYPMIYDFLVEQARTTNTNQPTRDSLADCVHCRASPMQRRH